MTQHVPSHPAPARERRHRETILISRSELVPTRPCRLCKETPLAAFSTDWLGLSVRLTQCPTHAPALELVGLPGEWLHALLRLKAGLLR